MKEIAEAIKSVMEDVNWVAKNTTVWSWTNSYKWVSDKDVKEKMRESMIKNWLSILPTWVNSKIQIDRWEEIDTYAKVKEWENRPTKTKQSIFTEVETKYILLHTSWESIELAWYWQWVDTQDKGAGKATTYALKNTLLNMFLIPTWVDTDDTHSDEYDIPKSKKQETPKAQEKTKWFELSEKNKDVIKKRMTDENKTPQEVIDWLIKNWYSINEENKTNILNINN